MFLDYNKTRTLILTPEQNCTLCVPQECCFKTIYSALAFFGRCFICARDVFLVVRVNDDKDLAETFVRIASCKRKHVLVNRSFVIVSAS